MAKRLSTSQSNTLFSYFTSPKAQTPKQSKASEKVKMETEEDSDEEITIQKKKRRRIAIVDSDSDSENVETTPKSILKKPKSGKENLKDFSFNKADTPPRQMKPIETPKKSSSTPKKTLFKDEDAARWTHEKVPFLKPENIRDANKRKPKDPDYDCRTLFVPEDYLNSLTPAMRQWWVLKSQHMDSVLFFKVGKFYELYHMDATVGVDYLGFSYMKGEFAHSGFPESAYGKMAQSLIEQGFKVARVEQTETPDMMAERCKGRKTTKFDKVVNREICQISTKGTLIYGAQLTDAKQPLAEYMIAIAENAKDNKTRFGVCFIDTSIGIFYLSEFDDDMHRSRLLALLAQHPPSLLIMERNQLHPETSGLLSKSMQNIRKDSLAPDTQFYNAKKVITMLSTECYFKGDGDEVKWPDVLSDIIKDGICKPGYELALKSLGGCVWYLKDSQIDIQVLSMAKFEIYEPIDTSKKSGPLKQDYMVLDAVTINNLKLLGGPGTLQKTLDYCVTPFGKRLMQQWIVRPLCDIRRIKERQLAIEELGEKDEVYKRTREILNKLPDLERQIAKIHSFGNKFCSVDHPDSRAVLYEGKVYAKRKIFDLLSTLQAFEKCLQIPSLYKDCTSVLLCKITQPAPKGAFYDLSETIEFFKEAFDHKKAKEEGIVIPQAGVDKSYDDIQKEIKDIEDDLADYLEEQRRFFRCEVQYFGNDKKRYQLEIPESKTHKATHEYSLESTRKGSKPCKRYSTATTKNFLARMLEAEGKKAKILLDLNRRIFEKFSNKYDQWAQVLHCIMLLDCLCCLREYGNLTHGTTIPTVTPFSDKPYFCIEGGRHPCIASDDFVENDTTFGIEDKANILILTGPNMGGKSTLMRQVALICIMSQMGSPVPAQSCSLTLVDRIFTRLGAHDDIFKNQSTFLVEMHEACSILRHSTRSSLVLLDELGRGTSTHDGTAVATSYVRKLCEINCRTLFTTHYHSLVEYFQNNPAIQMGYMMCMVEHEGDMEKERVIFLYKMGHGICPKSYGFNVAKLAGLPTVIVNGSYKAARHFETVAKNRSLLAAILKCANAQEMRKIISTF